ncbi:MAG TPA: extracellular solute-binding protein, partial [Candidatus Wallbacteria bacterium]|nr:extracellular solute-binding protein [Candidatus Wallbacteria bacterium]
MKKSVLFACLVSLILFFNGCGGARPAVQEGPAQKKKITFLNYFSNTLSYGNAQLIKSFNDHSSEYELEATTLDHEAFKTSIYETLKAGNPPDIYSNWAGARVRAVLEHLEPIDDIWKEGNLDKSFNRSLIDTACTYDGRKYLIPISQHFIAFFYNKKIFDDLKLTPPANWNDFLKVCDAIKKAGVTPIALGSKTKWPAQFWFDYLLLRTAPYEYREKLLKGEAGYKDRESLAAFKLWSDLVL